MAGKGGAPRAPSFRDMSLDFCLKGGGKGGGRGGGGWGKGLGGGRGNGGRRGGQLINAPSSPETGQESVSKKIY